MADKVKRLDVEYGGIWRRKQRQRVVEGEMFLGKNEGYLGRRDIISSVHPTGIAELIVSVNGNCEEEHMNGLHYFELCYKMHTFIQLSFIFRW